MDERQLKRLWNAIEKTEKLFLENGDPLDWSDNIVNGSKGLETKMEWGNYIQWLHNSEDFQVKNEIEFADLENCDIFDDYEYPSHFEQIEYKNGTDTVIHIKNNHFYEPTQTQDDEKSST